MAKYRNRTPEELAEAQRLVLHTATVMFLEKGYAQTTLRKVCDQSGLDLNAVTRAYGSKENILLELVKRILKKQFATAKTLIDGKSDDPILFYAVETTLQLHIAESHEHIRELYAAAYSMPNTTEYIQHTITGKLESIFASHLPELKTKDFYELEIASGGIMRNFMLVPCDMYFTMDRKVKRFLETTFRVYQVPDRKIEETIDFVSQFDFVQTARTLIDDMLESLRLLE